MNKNLVKAFFVGLLGLFAFITLLSLFIPSKLMITKSVVINNTSKKVYTQISNLQNWKNWQPVFVSDSAKIKFNDIIPGVSNSCQWISADKLNKIEITSATQNLIQVSQQREGESPTLNSIKVIPLTDSMQTQVDWNILIKLKWYPWEKFYGLFAEKLTGQGYEDALNSLKQYVEKEN